MKENLKLNQKLVIESLDSYGGCGIILLAARNKAARSNQR
jgi:hypothetical protein